jgi:hypothetical protein
MLKKFETVGKSLSREESKQIIGGGFASDTGFDEAGCGTGIDCTGSAVGTICGSKGTCVCESHSGGIWCNTQI